MPCHTIFRFGGPNAIECLSHQFTTLRSVFGRSLRRSIPNGLFRLRQLFGVDHETDQEYPSIGITWGTINTVAKVFGGLTRFRWLEEQYRPAGIASENHRGSLRPPSGPIARQAGILVSSGRFVLRVRDRH